MSPGLKSYIYIHIYVCISKVLENITDNNFLLTQKVVFI